MDILIPFVESDDDAWLDVFLKAKNLHPKNEKARQIFFVPFRRRYSSHGLFKYWWRALEQNYKDLGKVHLLLMQPSQFPSFLNKDDPRIVVHYHNEFIPEKHRPCFNSSTIELCAIKELDLKGNFILANDDMYANAPVDDSCFEQDGKPLAFISGGDSYGVFNQFRKTLTNGHKLVMGHYCKPLPYYRWHHLFQVYNAEFCKAFLNDEWETISKGLGKWRRDHDYNHMLLHYNRDLVRGANLVDPIELESKDEWTWETFKQYCRVLTTDEESEDKIVGGSMPLGYTPVSVMFLEGWGGKYYDTANKKVYFKSDEKVLEGVMEMVGIVEENIFRYEPVDQNGTGAQGINTSAASRRDFSSYRTVFGSLVFPSFATIGREYEQKGIDWDVVSMPATPVHKVGTGATGFVVFNGTKNKDAAAALTLSLYTPEGQRAYNGQEGGSVPNVRSLADDSFWRVPFADRRDDPEEGKNYYAFVSYPEADTYGRIECVLPPDIAKIVTTALQNLVPNVVNGKMSADTLLEKLETEANLKWESLYNE